MSKRVSNKRGTNVGARSYRTGTAGREKAYQARQRAEAEELRLNPRRPYEASQAVRPGFFRRAWNRVKKQFQRRATYA